MDAYVENKTHTHARTRTHTHLDFSLCDMVDGGEVVAGVDKVLPLSQDVDLIIVNQ